MYRKLEFRKVFHKILLDVLCSDFYVKKCQLLGSFEFSCIYSILLCKYQKELIISIKENINASERCTIVNDTNQGLNLPLGCLKAVLQLLALQYYLLQYYF